MPDLVDFGMIPELLGRFLNADMLLRILIEPADHVFDPDHCSATRLKAKAIARLAMKRKTSFQERLLYVQLAPFCDKVIHAT